MMSRTGFIFVLRAKTPEERESCFTVRREVFVEEQKVPIEYEYDEYGFNPCIFSHYAIRNRLAPRAWCSRMTALPQK